jgi:hypothetical protein
MNVVRILKIYDPIWERTNTMPLRLRLLQVARGPTFLETDLSSLCDVATQQYGPVPSLSPLP